MPFHMGYRWVFRQKPDPKWVHWLTLTCYECCTKFLAGYKIGKWIFFFFSFSFSCVHACGWGGLPTKSRHSHIHHPKGSHFFPTLSSGVDIFHLFTSSSGATLFSNSSTPIAIGFLHAWCSLFPGVILFIDLFKCFFKVVLESFAQLALRALATCKLTIQYLF